MRSLVLSVAGACACHASAFAQTFRVDAGSGNGFGNAGGCAFSDVSGTPVSDSSSCAGNYGASALAGAWSDRGTVHAHTHTDWPGTCFCSLGVELGGSGNLSVNDLVFTGPVGATSVQMQARIDVDGLVLQTDTRPGWSVASAGCNVQLSISGVGGININPTSDGRYSLNAATVALNSPCALYLYVEAYSSSGYYWTADATASITAHMPQGEPVFVLPDGYTANCPSLNIVNNMWYCGADFNQDGFVTGDDFDAFSAAFDAGDASADVNHDGFTTGDDFDYFAQHFDAGC